MRSRAEGDAGGSRLRGEAMGSGSRAESVLKGGGIQEGWTMLGEETLRCFCKSVNCKRRATENPLLIGGERYC